jgi:site-specific recombinase XerD
MNRSAITSAPAHSAVPFRPLRHACGYKLANDGHDTHAIQAYLGHRNIQNTTRYTALAPQRFKEFSETEAAPAAMNGGGSADL